MAQRFDVVDKHSDCMAMTGDGEELGGKEQRLHVDDGRVGNDGRRRRTSAQEGRDRRGDVQQQTGGAAQRDMAHVDDKFATIVAAGRRRAQHLRQHEAVRTFVLLTCDLCYLLIKIDFIRPVTSSLLECRICTESE